MPRTLEAWARWTLLALGLAFGTWLRVDGLGTAALFGDEYHTFLSCQAPLGKVFTTFDEVGSHVVLPLVQKASLALCGDGPLSFRLVALVPGLLLLWLAFPLARAFVDPTSALIATLALAVSPIHVYYSRFGRSYALGMLLGALFAWFLVRALRAPCTGMAARGAWIATALLGALLPYTHLTSAGLVAALGLAALGLARGRPRGVRPVLVAFGAAALLVVVLFLPLIGQVRHYLSGALPEGDGARPRTWFGIPLLLAGGVSEAWVGLALVPLGLVALLRERRDAGLLAAVAVAGPWAVLLATQPRGMEYAHARYLLNALPFLGLAAARGLVLLGELALGELGRRLTLGLATLALGASFLAGPLGPRLRERGTLSNTYLALHPLPAFDAPWPGRSPFYDQLAAASAGAACPPRVVETPPMQSRSVLLLRGLARVHGGTLVLGWPGPLPAALRGAPYVELDALQPGDAEYVVLHRNLRSEVDAYWDFVYGEAWPKVERAVDMGFMELHKATFVHSQPGTDPEFANALAAHLRDRFGPAFYKDERVLVWKLGG
jgi:hypothetical protein